MPNKRKSDSELKGSNGQTEKQTRTKRQRTEPNGVENGGDNWNQDERLPKRKVAVLLGYCGSGYQGMQINNNVKTIEEDLFNAFVQAGAVSKDNAEDMKKVQFMRAARTDKGVHAMGQCVSLKMIIQDPDIILKINSYLPAQIRVWDIMKTTNGFHAKNACGSRIYEYMLPTHVLQDSDPAFFPRSALAKKNGFDISAAHVDLSKLSPEELSIKFSTREINEVTPEEMRIKREYRITPEKLDQLKNILACYKGTHNYHNFTNGKDFKEANSNRYIMSFECSQPFIRQDTEWVSLKVHGQSFMLHQIRKMVGLAILMIRTHSPLSIINQAFGKIKKNIPKAPALGLALLETVFESYNDKWTSTERPAVQFSHKKEVMDAFKEEWIYSRMIQEELEKNEFEAWVRSVEAHSADFEWYFTVDGIVDESQKPPYMNSRFTKEDIEASAINVYKSKPGDVSV